MDETEMVEKAVKDLVPGDTIIRSETRVSVLREPEEHTETAGPLAGRPGLRVWCRREDTGAEGYMYYGPGASVSLVDDGPEEDSWDDDDDEDQDDKPDEEDGFITDTRHGYEVSFSAKYRATYPRYGMAMHALAALMIAEGFFPNAWHVDERGYTDNIGAEVSTHETEDGALKPIEGAQYQPGQTVIVSGPLSDWPVWVVLGDYGADGLWMHTAGDPGVIMVAEGDDREHIRASTDDDFE